MVWFSLVITINLFFLAKNESGMSLSLNWLFVSQLVSLVGTTLLTLSFLLSGRFRLVEDWFGGLDKVYRFHHLTGGISFVFLLHHPLFLAVNALPNTALSWKYLWFSELLPYNMGIISLYFMLLMIIFTLFIKLPYSLWKTTHELMGIALFFAVLHILTISSDVSRYLPLKMWMYFLLGMAIYSVIYRRFLYGYFGPKFNYLVKNIARKADILDVTLMPLIKKINYLPGQFVFIKFNDINKEVHPFSIAGCDEVGNLRIAVKILGDYTLMMNTLQEGSSVTLWGPYGKFWENSRGAKNYIWIAGGIGITPFLSLLEEEVATIPDRKIDFFYCVNSEEEAVFHQEILSRTEDLPSINYYKHCSNQFGRIDAKKIVSSVGNLIDKKIMICGPVSMMTSLADQFGKMGIGNKHIIFEDFNFK